MGVARRGRRIAVQKPAVGKERGGTPPRPARWRFGCGQPRVGSAVCLSVWVFKVSAVQLAVSSAQALLRFALYNVFVFVFVSLSTIVPLKNSVSQEGKASRVFPAARKCSLVLESHQPEETGICWLKGHLQPGRTQACPQALALLVCKLAHLEPSPALDRECQGQVKGDSCKRLKSLLWQVILTHSVLAHC